MKKNKTAIKHHCYKENIINDTKESKQSIVADPEIRYKK